MANACEYCEVYECLMSTQMKVFDASWAEV